MHDETLTLFQNYPLNLLVLKSSRMYKSPCLETLNRQCTHVIINGHFFFFWKVVLCSFSRLPRLPAVGSVRQHINFGQRIQVFHVNILIRIRFTEISFRIFMNSFSFAADGSLLLDTNSNSSSVSWINNKVTQAIIVVVHSEGNLNAPNAFCSAVGKFSSSKGPIYYRFDMCNSVQK
jgi:hypothetical protein